MALTLDDFGRFFEEIHGSQPFPWQTRLLKQIVRDKRWPSVLDIPTGCGKTATIDIAVFHLALEAARATDRSAPIRIAFVVDRRLVVDDTFRRACDIGCALAAPDGRAITAEVAKELGRLSGDGPPLVVQRLRGGIPQEAVWARTPAQPTILCSTVDQVGSRLLFRGYGVSDSMKPVHAGLLGSDCLILLDEAHLAEPLRQTLEAVSMYRGPQWCGSKPSAPWQVSTLSATPGVTDTDRFSLDDDDRSDPVLRARIDSPKRARLVRVRNSNRGPDQSGRDEATGDSLAEAEDTALRISSLADQVDRAIEHFTRPAHGTPHPAIAVIVNRVARARAVFQLLRARFRDLRSDAELPDLMLMIGPCRSVDRVELSAALEPIRTRSWANDERRHLRAPLIVVATQCIEVGVDVDFDALITEHAPLDALVQRFGRLNRGARPIAPYAAVVGLDSDLASGHADPVYGRVLKPTWEELNRTQARQGLRGQVDFASTAIPSETNFAIAAAAKPDAPTLLPAHLDLLTQTSPIPAADPEVSLYLHGPKLQPDGVTLIWRADIDSSVHRAADVRRLLMLIPPRMGEGIELPVWAVRAWLSSDRRSQIEFADVPAAGPSADSSPLSEGSQLRRAFRWKGDDDRSNWIEPTTILPGDTLVVPAGYGGMDEFGWAPEEVIPVTDVAQVVAAPYRGRRYVVRVAAGLVESGATVTALADCIAAHVMDSWQNQRDYLLDCGLSEELREDLLRLNYARRNHVIAYRDIYGTDAADRPRGIVFVAPFGISGEQWDSDAAPDTTDGGARGSLADYSMSLDAHSEAVASKAAEFAALAGLSVDRVSDLRTAGLMHDAGKCDPRFQAWLHYGDPLGPDPNRILAKSARRLPRHARGQSGLPEHWRHEAKSVTLLLAGSQIANCCDPELVAWLIGTHHGYGRPFFPHSDPAESPPEVGPQSLAFDWKLGDWASLFERMNDRYGIWELARMEAILRLADHRASEAGAKEAAE